MRSVARAARTGPKDDACERAMMLDVNDVAAMLNCSPRTICCLSDSGRMPPPVKLGTLAALGAVPHEEKDSLART